jgi:protein-L-isoaspartate(D-aspartate) O-methyltransferase
MNRAVACGLCLVMVVAAAAARMAVAQPPARQKLDPSEAARERMVRDDIAAGGVTDERVLAAMRATPRHEFVPGPQRNLAYFDMSLPIGEAQTISGPFVVAYMTEKLEPEPTDRVLEIGTGSGYQAAVLATLVRTVYSIEIQEKLGEKAAKTLARLGYKNVVTKIGDGFLGWPEHAPFDKIIVTCSPEDVPRPLVEQLAEGGRMVIPVGERYDQTLVLLAKREGRLEREALVPSLFVPMTGTAEQGRKVQPDASRPAIDNGGFETLLPDSTVPTAWYYGRQMELVEADDAPEGRRYLRLTNTDPGRPAQVFQGFPVDGRTVARLTVQAQLRAEGVRAGLASDEAPALVVKFFDEDRSRSARAFVGPWGGTFPWKEVQGTVPVPTWAREAILQVGMLGGTGQIEVDAVAIGGIAR